MPVPKKDGGYFQHLLYLHITITFLVSLEKSKVQINDIHYWVAIGYTLHNLQEVDIQLSRNGFLTVQLK